jgi:hypothetical protein
MKLLLFIFLLVTIPKSKNGVPFKTLTETERKYAISQLEESRNQLEAELEGLTPEQLSFKATPQIWSIAEITEHIGLAETGIGQIVAGTLQQPADSSRRKEIKVTDTQVRLILTNRTGKATAPEIIKPTGRFSDIKTAMAFFDKARDKNIDLIKTTQEDLRNRYWQHPATGTIDLYQAVLLTAAHCERHIAQIKELKHNNLYSKQ